MLIPDRKRETLSSLWNRRMSSKCSPKSDADQPTVYQIRIKSHLSRQRIDWSEGLTITLEEDGNTLLNGPEIDQSALHGILKKICDLGMPLLSVHSVETGTQEALDNERVTYE